MASYSAFGHSQADELYPPLKYDPNASTVSFKSEDVRTTRTPSPTPSEAAELAKPGIVDWKTYRDWRFWIRKEWAWYYVIFVVILVLVALISIYHTQIVHWLTPAANWMHNLPVGWLIPIAILFVLSFPPLFGHEIVAILCGLVWGLWIGFAIVAAGTFIGELGNFFAFKYLCHARAEKLEKTKLPYACLAKAVREGGIKIALIARFSAIPGHFTTAIFSTCGMTVLTFSIAAFLTLPKQFVTVYIGVLLQESSTGTETSKSKLISDIVLAITFIITAVAMWYILREMNKYKVSVIYDRRKARQAQMLRTGRPYGNGEASYSTAFNPTESDSDLPYGDSQHQQWDKNGRAVGFSGDPRIHSPVPQRAGPSGTASPARIPTFRTESGGGFSAGGARYEGAARTRQESTDTVTWDPQQGAANAYEMPRLASPPGLRLVGSPAVRQASPKAPILPPPPRADVPPRQPPSATPTQAQFAVQPLPSGDITSAPLPTPSYPTFTNVSSSPSAPAAQQYEQFSSMPNPFTDDSRVGTEVPPLSPPQRAFSPRPPSYRSAPLQ